MTVLTKNATKTKPKLVGLGQIVVGSVDDHLCSVLGSCIAVALHHPRVRVGAMAHVVLPESNGQTEPAGKFADTAVARMLQLLQQEGANPAGLVAKITGGASMFGKGGPLQIGRANAEAVEKALDAVNIRLKAAHVGENKGRRVTLDCGTGELRVEVAGQEAVVL